jgi:glycosyltransferase involved in cell wall biosynthesis
MQKTVNPLVTIGIPTYNRANSYLKYSLESALRQTYQNIEIIVTDNCSPDATREVVLGYGDERIKYHRHDSPVKPHENAHYCLENAQGAYFLMLHDDDLIDDDFIEVCIHAIGEKDVGVVQTGARTIDSQGNIKKERINPHSYSSAFEYFQSIMHGKGITYFCNSLYNTKYLKEMGGFRSRTFSYEDVATNIRMVHRHNRVTIEEVKASYRLHNSKLGSASGIKSWCDDSLFLIDLMSDLIPEHRDYFQREGREGFSKRNYHRARRIVKPLFRPYAYYIVYNKFGYSYSPFRFVFRKYINKLSHVRERIFNGRKSVPA